MDDIDTIALWDAVAAANDPADCDVTRLALADRLSEIGDGDMEYALRWAVKHGRTPEISQRFLQNGTETAWRWRTGEWQKEDFPCHIPRIIWEANEYLRYRHCTYHKTICDAYRQLGIALKTIREAIAI